MTIDYIAELQHGSQKLNLADSGKYCPMSDFVPPGTREAPLLARGTAQSRYAGSQLISTRANDYQWNFTIACDGTTEGECRMRARKLVSFLRYAGDETTPLQLHYRANNDIADEPLWGDYGTNMRYTIIHATTNLRDSYALSDIRKKIVYVEVSALIAPFGSGKQMRLASAKGGIIEDTLGTVDGSPRGLIIPEATTNKMTNPVFGHSTWNNGWTAGTVTASENTDDEFLYPGASSSAKVVGTGAGTFYQSINVGNTNTHTISFYVKLPDSGTVSVTQCSIYYGATKTSIYTEIGDGVWRVSWSGAGINASTTTGLNVTAANTVFVMGAQIEEKAYATPLCWGDLLGCAWSGTAHASTSTRTAANWKMANASVLNVAEGSICLTVKMAYANTHPNNLYFWNNGTSLRAYFLAADDKFYLTDNTNTISTAAQALSVGEIVSLVFTWGPSGLNIYKNGSNAATGATYTPPTLGANLYLGSDTSTAQHGGYTILDFRAYATDPTAAEVLADYTNIAQIVADDMRVGCIPWLWTKDGDDIVDNCDDSTRDNWAVCGGVPGTVEAETEYEFLSGTAVTYISNWYLDKFLNPSNLYFDQSGTVDANSSGGEYKATSVGTTSTTIGSGTITADVLETILGKDCVLMTRAQDVSNNDYSLVFGITEMGINSAAKPVTGLAYFRSIVTSGIVLPESIVTEALSTNSVTVALSAYHASGTNNIECDYFQIVPHPLMSVPNEAGVTSYVRAGQYTYSSMPGGSYFTGGITGNFVNLFPQKYNILLHYQFGTGLADVSITATVTHTSIKVTPRYMLL